jgi:hypothetical protein
MVLLTRSLVFLVLGIIAGGGIFLAMWDMPPPSAEVVKVIPNERFQR